LWRNTFVTDRERRRLAKMEKKHLRRLAKLGISNFDGVDTTERRQIDLINRLRGTQIDIAGLEDCGPLICGRAKCAEGCPFGIRRRRLKEIIATHRLLTTVGGPVNEVWVARGSWARPVGKLREVSIGASTKSIRRALDKVSKPGIVAVGMLKLSRRIGPLDVWWWQPVVHLVVAGAEKADLEQALQTRPRRGENLCQVNKVKNVGQLISKVLRRDVRASKQPWFYQLSTTKAQRREFYEWSLHRGERMIRYGCDRYFNALKKQPRRPKIPKKRPYPKWLESDMFGSKKWENSPPHSMTYQPKDKNVRVVDPPDDYCKLDRK
jgi:hypothetical protein